MRFQTLAGALALVGSSTAFSDSSPLILLSSAPLKDAPAPKQIQTKAKAMDYVHSVLDSCPTQRYLFVNQAGVHASQLQSSDCQLPSLCKATDGHDSKSKYVVPEVMGPMGVSEAQRLLDYTMQACSNVNKDAAGAEIMDMTVASSDRAGALLDNDALLSERLTSLSADKDYTIVFLSAPAENTLYEADFEDAVEMDLKRHVQGGSSLRRADNETDWNKLPLFEKYQFFTPGVFMGLITAIILFSILGVGLKALSSLEVSYGAFEKDMGPAAQKKQQ